MLLIKNTFSVSAMAVTAAVVLAHDVPLVLVDLECRTAIPDHAAANIELPIPGSTRDLACVETLLLEWQDILGAVAGEVDLPPLDLHPPGCPATP